MNMNPSPEQQALIELARDLAQNKIAARAARYDRDILVVETAYPWTLEWVDDTQNAVGGMSPMHPGYEPTPGGQRRFLADLAATVAATPGDRGRGFFYWSPERVATPGYGSQWENVSMFDGTGELLPVVRMLGRPIDETPVSGEPDDPE